MLLIDNFSQVAAQIETERGISKKCLIEAIEQALISACKRRFEEEVNLSATVDPQTGEATIYQDKEVVKAVADEQTEISIPEARKLKGIDIKAGDTINIDITPADFGRLAAQTAKQVIMQRIREEEKEMVFNEFNEKVGKIMNGTIQRIENQNYLINLGRTEAILSHRNQIPGERFQVKEKVKVYIESIERETRGTFVKISRTHSFRTN